jgi:hypothetical protein
MMGIDGVVTNGPDVNLQSYDLTAAFRNSMSDCDPKDRSFCLYAWTKVLWMSCGVLISMRPSS